MAVATSLLIIAPSWTEFIGDVEKLEIEWQFLLSLTTLFIIGSWLNRFISRDSLQKKIYQNESVFSVIDKSELISKLQRSPKVRNETV